MRNLAIEGSLLPHRGKKDRALCSSLLASSGLVCSIAFLCVSPWPVDDQSPREISSRLRVTHFRSELRRAIRFTARLHFLLFSLKIKLQLSMKSMSCAVSHCIRPVFAMRSSICTLEKEKGANLHSWHIAAVLAPQVQLKSAADGDMP